MCWDEYSQTDLSPWITVHQIFYCNTSVYIYLDIARTMFDASQSWLDFEEVSACLRYSNSNFLIRVANVKATPNTQIRCHGIIFHNIDLVLSRGFILQAGCIV